MKTITEFDATRLKNAAQVQKDLQTAGKTTEELPQAMGESLKLEGDPLNLLLNALAVAESSSKKFNDLKRVVVLSLNEGEKAPSHAQQKGEHHYMLEYYPPVRSKEAPPQQHSNHDRGPGRGRDQKPGKRGDQRGKPRNPSAEGNNRDERSDRRPPRRGPRPQGQPTIQAGGTPRPLPVIKPKTTPPADPTPETPPTP